MHAYTHLIYTYKNMVDIVMHVCMCADMHVYICEYKHVYVCVYTYYGTRAETMVKI